MGVRPDGTMAGSAKRLASRFYQVKTGHCLTGEYLHWTKSRPPLSAGGAAARSRRGITSSRCTPSGKLSRRFCGQRCGRRREVGRAGSIRDFLAGRRCNQAVLDFLSTTDVGRLVPAEEDAGNKVSEWELRERATISLGFPIVRTLFLL